jgi:hypothetical protein
MTILVACRYEVLCLAHSLKNRQECLKTENPKRLKNTTRPDLKHVPGVSSAKSFKFIAPSATKMRSATATTEPLAQTFTMPHSPQPSRSYHPTLHPHPPSRHPFPETRNPTPLSRCTLSPRIAATQSLFAGPRPCIQAPHPFLFPSTPPSTSTIPK